jgi:thiol-disulfide isomerase/thioredoxin
MLSGPADGPFSLSGATGWLSSPPLSIPELRGRVVLINFWTYTCINWLRSLPYIRAWDAAYRSHGLVTIGVHAPEFSFERDRDNVVRAVDALSVHHPIAIDNRFAVWRSFGNHYWPALYLFDGGGRLRHHWFGEGGYDETETVLRQLLVEAGAEDLDLAFAPVEAHGVEAAPNWSTLRSTETYLGYERSSGFAPVDAFVADQPRSYQAPRRLRPGQWALSGRWAVGGESAALHESGGRVSCRFQARDLHLVAAPGADGSAVRLRLQLDGRDPGDSHGIDADLRGYGSIAEPRLHQLVRTAGSVRDRTVDITFLDPGVQLYAFTFG